MLTVTKTYADLKAAHRQWRHPGHCKGVHGERWTIRITFAAHSLDEHKFIVDFGGLRGLRDKLEDLFDHTLLIDADDPERSTFEALHGAGLAKVQFLPSACSEGICRYVYELAQAFIEELCHSRVWVEQVVVEEDPKNTATLNRDAFRGFNTRTLDPA